MKKEIYNYFDEFVKMADCIIASSEILKDVFENFNPENLEVKTLEVHKLENEVDDIVHAMRNYLISDFLPPIDRNDLAILSNKIDDIEDSIDEIMINLKILNINEIKIEVNELTEILYLSTKVVKEMFVNLNNLKRVDLIKEKIIEINKLEDSGDKAYEKVMSLLYRNETNPIELIKWTNIYNWIEDAIDFCEHVSDCVEDFILINW